MTRSRLQKIDPDRPRLYGRAKGRPLSAKQAGYMEKAYPQIRFDPDGEFNPSPFKKVWFELGFGGSEHLIWQAKHNPDICVIGAEPFINGVAKAVTSVVEKRLENVILYQGDGREVMDALSDGSLLTVFVLFPDPWPKARHNKRRVITPAFLRQVHRLLKPGGRFRFASDIPDYVDWALTRIKAHGGFDWRPTGKVDWLNRPDDWPQTRYEAKAIREGRTCHYFEFRRI